LLASLAAFCAETPGYETGLRGDALTRLRLPPLVERIPTALSETECLRLIAACADVPRDRLIVETFLLSGLRVSELCALTVDAIHLETRPAYLDVHGSVHNPHRPKTPRERRIVVDYDLCESNAICMGILPEVFEVRDDDFLYVLNESPGEELRDKVMECVRSCPKQAISVNEE